jgi:hypothetical protein
VEIEPVNLDRGAYDALYCYALSHGGPSFILQHVVDAFAAQCADEHTKPIAITFALVGLYLHVEKGFSGRQVQQVHMKLGQRKYAWPSFDVPSDRGAMTAADVMAVAEGPERDAAIDAWCRAVWNSFGASHRSVGQLLAEHGIVPSASSKAAG